jgi:hypothetical protein
VELLLRPAATKTKVVPDLAGGAHFYLQTANSSLGKRNGGGWAVRVYYSSESNSTPWDVPSTGVLSQVVHDSNANDDEVDRDLNEFLTFYARALILLVIPYQEEIEASNRGGGAMGTLAICRRAGRILQSAAQHPNAIGTVRRVVVVPDAGAAFRSLRYLTTESENYRMGPYGDKFISEQRALQGMPMIQPRSATSSRAATQTTAGASDNSQHHRVQSYRERNQGAILSFATRANIPFMEMNSAIRIYRDLATAQLAPTGKMGLPPSLLVTLADPGLRSSIPFESRTDRLVSAFFDSPYPTEREMAAVEASRLGAPETVVLQNPFLQPEYEADDTENSQELQFSPAVPAPRVELESAPWRKNAPVDALMADPQRPRDAPPSIVAKPVEEYSSTSFYQHQQQTLIGGGLQTARHTRSATAHVVRDTGANGWADGNRGSFLAQNQQESRIRDIIQSQSSIHGILAPSETLRSGNLPASYLQPKRPSIGTNTGRKAAVTQGSRPFVGRKTGPRSFWRPY